MPNIVVLHKSHGCESGCCGHVVQVDGEDAEFRFEHPYGRPEKEWAEQYVSRCGLNPSELDWENSVVLDD